MLLHLTWELLGKGMEFDLQSRMHMYTYVLLSSGSAENLYVWRQLGTHMAIWFFSLSDIKLSRCDASELEIVKHIVEFKL